MQIQEIKNQLLLTNNNQITEIEILNNAMLLVDKGEFNPDTIINVLDSIYKPSLCYINTNEFDITFLKYHNIKYNLVDGDWVLEIDITQYTKKDLFNLGIDYGNYYANSNKVKEIYTCETNFISYLLTGACD